MSNLTPKQEMFVKEYLVDLNGTQAAIRAGYSSKTAFVIAEENLKKPEIKAAIEEAMETRRQKLGLDAEWVLKNLKEVVDRCLRAVAVLDKEGNPTGEYRFDANGANRALELIGKHLAMFTEKISTKVDITTVKTIEQLLDEL